MQFGCCPAGVLAVCCICVSALQWLCNELCAQLLCCLWFVTIFSLVVMLRVAMLGFIAPIVDAMRLARCVGARCCMLCFDAAFA